MLSTNKETAWNQISQMWLKLIEKIKLWPSIVSKKNLDYLYAFFYTLA